MRARGRPCRLQTRRGPRALVPREVSRSGLSGGSEAGNPLTQSPRARPGTRNVSPSVHLPSFGGKLGTGHGLGEPLKPPPALSASLWPASPGPVQPCPARCISRLGSLCRHLHQPRPHAPCSLPSSSLGGPLASPPLSTSAWCLWSARLQVLPAPPHVLRLCSRRLALPQPRTCLRATPGVDSAVRLLPCLSLDPSTPTRALESAAAPSVQQRGSCPWPRGRFLNWSPEHLFRGIISSFVLFVV